jgi:hypothetical protein
LHRLLRCQKLETFKIDREFRQKELNDRFLMMKKRLPNTSFSFHDTVIDIVDDNRVEVITTLRINGKIVDQQFTDAYELDIMVDKKDGGWRFSSFTLVEFMKKKGSSGLSLRAVQTGAHGGAPLR